MQYYKLLFLSIFLAGLVSCDFMLDDTERQEKQEEDPTLPCGVEDPLTDLAWLKEIKQQMEMNMGMAGSQIIQYTYDERIYFWVDLCYRCPDNLIILYNCNGQTVCQFGGISGLNTCPDFLENVSDSTVLFSNVQL